MSSLLEELFQMYRAFKALQNENPPGDLSKPQLDGDSGKTKASHFYELVPFPANPFLNGCRGIIRMGGENISDFLEYVAKKFTILMMVPIS